MKKKKKKATDRCWRGRKKTDKFYDQVAVDISPNKKAITVAVLYPRSMVYQVNLLF